MHAPRDRPSLIPSPPPCVPPLQRLSQSEPPIKTHPHRWEDERRTGLPRENYWMRAQPRLVPRLSSGRVKNQNSRSHRKYRMPIYVLSAADSDPGPSGAPSTMCALRDLCQYQHGRGVCTDTEAVVEQEVSPFCSRSCATASRPQNEAICNGVPQSCPLLLDLHQG